MSAVGSAGVLRGMPVSAAPLRLRRSSSASGQVPATEPLADASSAIEDALRRGYEDGLREGREEAREEGLRSGREEGWRQGEREAALAAAARLQEAIGEARRPLAEERARLAQLLVSLQDAHAHCLAASEEEMLALCYEAVCRVVGAQAVDPRHVASQLSHLVALSRISSLVAVHVHPDDAALLQGGDMSTGKESQGGDRQVPWLPDPEVTLGGCIVRGSRGSLDLRLEAMLSGLKASLLAERARRRQATAPGSPA